MVTELSNDLSSDKNNIQIILHVTPIAQNYVDNILLVESKIPSSLLIYMGISVFFHKYWNCLGHQMGT